MQLRSLSAWALVAATAAIAAADKCRSDREPWWDETSLLQTGRSLISKRYSSADELRPWPKGYWGNGLDPIQRKRADEAKFPDSEADQDIRNWAKWELAHPHKPSPLPTFKGHFVQGNNIYVNYNRLPNGDIHIYGTPAKDYLRMVNGPPKPKNVTKNVTLNATVVNPHPSNLFPGWSSRSEIWDDYTCSNTGNKMSTNLQECFDFCEDTHRCNAVNHNDQTGDCILRACPLPIPEPKWRVAGYRGYRNQPFEKEENMVMPIGLAENIRDYLVYAGYPHLSHLVVNKTVEEIETPGIAAKLATAHKLATDPDDTWPVAVNQLVREVMQKNEIDNGVKGTYSQLPPVNYESVRFDQMQSRGPFQCHQYTPALGEDDHWCRARSQQVVDGYEFLFMDELSSELNPCPGCFCCKRQVMQNVLPVVTANAKLLYEDPTMFGGWQCHMYTLNQDDKWCLTRGDQIIQGFQYKYVAHEGIAEPLCGGCWCCKRELQQIAR